MAKTDLDQKSILPIGFQKFEPKPANGNGGKKVARSSDGIFCWNCSRRFGEDHNGNLSGSDMIMTNRTTFRCRGCKEKNLFEPAR